MKTFWYLWAAPDSGDPMKNGVLALGPFDTQEEVDAIEWSFRRWAEEHITGFHPWIKTGGIAYSKDKGKGRMSDHFKPEVKS